MPVRFATIFRVVVILALAAHVFFMYSIARVMREEFGITWSGFIVTSLFALAMLVPLLWLVWLPDAPEAYIQWRAANRWRKGRCTRCSYDISQTKAERCPECGTVLSEPSGYEFSMRTLRRFAVMNLLAWIVGVGAAELNLSLDERAFVREALVVESRNNVPMYSRSRSWPNGAAHLFHSTATGYGAGD